MALLVRDALKDLYSPYPDIFFPEADKNAVLSMASIFTDTRMMIVQVRTMCIPYIVPGDYEIEVIKVKLLGGEIVLYAHCFKLLDLTYTASPDCTELVYNAEINPVFKIIVAKNVKTDVVNLGLIKRINDEAWFDYLDIVVPETTTAKVVNS